MSILKVALAIAFHAILVVPFVAQSAGTVTYVTPESPQGLVVLARGDFHAGRYLEAVHKYRKSLEADPKNASAWEWLAESYKKLKQYDQALDAYKRSLELKPNNSNIYDNFSFIYAQVGKFEDAVVASEQAIKLNPKSDVAYVNLGFALTKLGRFEDAIAALKKALQITPEDIGLYNNLGEVYFRLGRFNDSIDILKRAIKLKPDDLWPHINIAKVYMSTENYDAVVQELRDATRIDPSNFEAVVNLAVAANRAGMNEVSVEAFTQSIRIKPQLASLFLGRGYSYLSMSRGELAANDAYRYLELSGGGDTRDVYAVLMAHFGLRQANRDQDAQRILFHSKLEDDTRSWQYSIVRYLRGEITGTTLLEQAVDGDKKTEANTYIGMNLLLSGNKSEAATHLTWVKDNGNKYFNEYLIAITLLSQMSQTRDK